MTPRIICHAGPSINDLQRVEVNGSPISIKSESFEGQVSIRLSNFHGSSPSGTGDSPLNPKTEYSNPTDTMSISFLGRFKEDALQADDILWGNQWEHPIRDYLPYGTSAALKIAPLIDPSLTHDIYADKPWALSPLLATMQRIHAKTLDPSSALPDYTPGPVEEDISILFQNEVDGEKLKGKPDQRRKWLANKQHRNEVKVGKDHLLECDFSNGFIDFDKLSLILPGGLKFSLEKYWDGQPVTFVCRRRTAASGETPHIYFVLTFELEGDKRAKPKHEEHEPQPEAKTETSGDKAGDGNTGEQVDELGVD